MCIIMSIINTLVSRRNLNFCTHLHYIALNVASIFAAWGALIGVKAGRGEKCRYGYLSRPLLSLILVIIVIAYNPLN